METAAFYHRPESEYCYIYAPGHVHVRLRTKKGDVAKVGFIQGDPFNLHLKDWYEEELEMELMASTDLHDYWLIDTDEYVKRMAYAFHIYGTDGSDVIYNDRGVFPYLKESLTNSGLYFRLPYFHETDRFKAPDWVKKTVWYQIFPERFKNGNPKNDPEGVLPWDSKEELTTVDFYGGDLQGILDGLDYLEDLGINGIYMTPIFTAPSNHKYDTTDYYEIDPHFGDKALFRKLVEEAHSRGMRVMLDAVFNHIGAESIQWRDVAEYQEESRYKDWFHIREFPVPSAEEIQAHGPVYMEHAENLPYETYSYVPMMPKINTHNPEVQEYLLNIATYWIKEFDIDGWRLDVANEVDHAFWRKFNTACTSLKPDFYLLGEIWTSSRSWLRGDEFHGVMNYSLVGNISDFFVGKTIPARKMANVLNEQLMQYRKQTHETMFNMLDSHDTPRILTMAEGNVDLVKSTLAFMFLMHGSPCIYYGTEVGMVGGADPQNRRCMVWEEERQDRDMYDFTKQLIQLRKEYQPLLSYGNLRWELVLDEEKVVGVKRILGEDQIIGYFNQGWEDYTIPHKANTEVIFHHLSNELAGESLIAPNGFSIHRVKSE
ncbi:glycoside hydrolase family 13 protein [Jeotgalibaca caeni]|uniref:glycoside hydrolase family 13 protein n=1 Tax=Jeotgalibaca caeni TaxID=3028623 RepID=UPI00237E378B|nr:glycoside hydrolase family 13 protein [Jeotgalibaca caeni]MDE1548173.1 glycoside hydrolase family 13 protein [Jeotgalibaca caeni]